MTGHAPPRVQPIASFKVYGLDTVLALQEGATKGELISAMQGHVLQFGNTTAMYSR